MNSRIVLSADDIARSLKRIAHEIVEANSGTDGLLILGIPTRGFHLSNRLEEIFEELYPSAEIEFGVLDVTMYRDDNVGPNKRIFESDLPPGGLENKVVVLVDDVLFSGRTIRAALDALVDFGRPKQVKLAVLVDRGHRELPIRPDFVGKNLPTSKDERVRVHLAEADGVDEVVIEQ